MRTKIESSPARRHAANNVGFSLIELLVVVAVILIIASIAIPNFIKSKMRANESAAAQNLRTITTAQVVYSTTYGIGFSSTLAQLTSATAAVDQNNAGLIDTVLAAGVKSGYSFTYAVLSNDPSGNVTGYSVSADPISVGNTGVRHFYSDQTAVIRSNGTTNAGPGDPPIS